MDKIIPSQSQPRPQGVEAGVTGKKIFVTVAEKDASSLRAASFAEDQTSQTSLFSRTVEAVKSSVSLNKILAKRSAVTNVARLAGLPNPYEPLITPLGASTILAAQAALTASKKPSLSTFLSVVRYGGSFMAALVPSQASAGKIVSSVGKISGATMGTTYRNNKLEGNAATISKLQEFSSESRDESVRAIADGIVNHLASQNLFHGAHAAASGTGAVLSAIAASSHVSKLMVYNELSELVKTGLGAPVAVATAAGASLLPIVLNWAQWFSGEQNKDTVHSVNAALQKALTLENAVQSYRNGEKDDAIKAAHEDADLCSFLGQWVETAPPEPPAFDQNYIDYFVENYETILNEMASQLIQSSPGGFGLAFLQDLTQMVGVEGCKDANELCKLFKLDASKSPEEFRKDAQKAFGISV